MRFVRIYFLIAIAIASFTTITNAQDLRVFGYGQVFHRTSMGESGSLFKKLGINQQSQGTTYLLQEFNLMASNNFGNGYSAFANLEFTNSFDQRYKWGNLTLQEMFAKYENQNSSFNVKLGYFIPSFNSFLEMYNRFPLMPYVFRPALYETNYWTYFTLEDFVPTKANIQIYGQYPLTDNIGLDYAIYHGNPEATFLQSYNPAAGNQAAGGANTGAITQFGAKVGIDIKTDNLGSIKFGGSLAIDEDNQKKVTLGNDLNNGVFLNKNLVAVKLKDGTSPFVNFYQDYGSIKRKKIGLDFNYNIGNFTLNAEMITVVNNLNTDQETKLNNLKKDLTNYVAIQNDTSKVPVTLPKFEGSKISEIDFDKFFYYISGEYRVIENATIFAFITKIQDHWNPVIQSGMDQMAFGCTYSPIEQIMLKAQYQSLKLTEPNIFAVDFKNSILLLAVSVTF